MKKILFLAVAILLAWVWFVLAPFALKAQKVEKENNFPVIRHFGSEYQDTWVRKFEDGPNTCYVAETLRTSGKVGLSISCVKR